MRQSLRTSITQRLDTGADLPRKFEMQRLMKNLTLTEEEVHSATEFPASLGKIDFRQYVSRGLMYFNNNVFNFFMSLHSEVQKHLNRHFTRISGISTNITVYASVLLPVRICFSSGWTCLMWMEKTKMQLFVWRWTSLK